MADRVLLVDDEAVFCSYVREMNLWNNGDFQLVGEVRGTDEAMQFLAEEEVDIVVFDVSMPGKNGVILSRMIGSQHPSISMVAVSSYDDYDYVRQILKNGVHDYILKHCLTEHQLQETLYAVHDKAQGISPWESKTKLRRQVYQWFFEEGESPFTSDNSRKAAMLIRIILEAGLSERQRRAITEGIGKIFEDNSTESKDVLALGVDPECFVILTRFYDEVSEAKMQEWMEYVKVISEDTVRRIYSMNLRGDYCPIFFSDRALRSYVLYKLKEKDADEIPEKMALTLTIGQQKELVWAIEKGDGKEAEDMIGCIFAKMPDNAQSTCLIVVRELLELIRKAAVEYQIALDFLPEDFGVYEYAKMRNRKKLADSIAGLYRNVIREINEVKERQKDYSEIVKRAIVYMEENYNRPISLKIVAAGIGANSSYLSRVFHDESGKTMTDYLNEIRIEASKNMLEEGLALKDIAGRCGFKNYNYFLKIFKDYTGTTPKEYLAK